MATTLAIPDEYGYVLLAAVSTSLINWLHFASTGSARRTARVPYPNAYATAAEAASDEAKHLFNCAQRAHANFLENQPSFLVTLLVAGLQYPRLSAGWGAVWVTGRLLYLVGYTRPGMKQGLGRYWGSQWYLAQLALTGMAGWTVWGMLAGR